MIPDLLPSKAASQVPSTKNWLLLLSLLSGLLLAGSRLQLPAPGATPPVLTGSPAPMAQPSERRVALKTSVPQHQPASALAEAVAL